MTNPTETGSVGAPDERAPTDVDGDEAFEVDDAFPAEAAGAALPDDAGVPSVEQERDEYRDALQRVKAEFDNYRKRTAKADSENRERAAETLVAHLLPVLDACDAAVLHDATDVGPISKMLVEILAKEGLEPMAPEGQPFDPTLHEAVLHEEGDGAEATVIESLRTGYLWKGRILRPAMVKVRG
jgi:molecular chaperone GrpE